MKQHIMKYNPSFLSDQELADSFVVRNAELESILRVVQDNVGNSIQHVLIVGPRGSGKTTLVLKVALEVRRRSDLNSRWFPILFSEESYEVSSAGQFWLEALGHLANQMNDPILEAVKNSLLREPDDQRLGQAALAKLMDFADEQNKRLLLIVENMNDLLGAQLNEKDAWSLRRILMNESRIMLLGSATSRFSGIDNVKHAMYELFKIVTLEPLDQAQSQSLWNRLTKQEITEERARAIQIITGGSARLVTIFSSFGANKSFKAFFDDILALVDENTDYFKSNIETLPPAERKVFVCLASLWVDSSAREVSVAARISSSAASALLTRLVNRGIVSVVSKSRGKKHYQLVERLYNIYYLMRRGQDGSRVKAVVNFMAQFYGGDHLDRAANDIAREVCCLDSSERFYHYAALDEILCRATTDESVNRIVSALPSDLFCQPDLPARLKQYNPIKSAERVRRSVVFVSDEIKNDLKNGLYRKVELCLREQLLVEPNEPNSLVILGGVLALHLGKREEGILFLRRAIELDGNSASILVSAGAVLAKIPDFRDEGVGYLRKAMALAPENPSIVSTLGAELVSSIETREEGIIFLRKVTESDPQNAPLMFSIGTMLAEFAPTREEGITYLRKTLALAPENPLFLSALGRRLDNSPGTHDEGLAYLRKAVELDPQRASRLRALGSSLVANFHTREEGLAYLRKAVELDPAYVLGWVTLGRCLYKTQDNREEGITCVRKALELAPQQTWVWASLGEILSRSHVTRKEGIECLRKALELNPQNAWTWIDLGEALVAFSPETVTEGRACFRKAVELKPKASWAWTSLGKFLVFSRESREEGFACLRKAIECDSEDDWAWCVLGRSIVQFLDTDEEGVRCLRKALEINPRGATNWLGLGEALAGNPATYDEGLTSLREAVAIAPMHGWAWSQLGIALMLGENSLDEGVVCLRRAVEVGHKWCGGELYNFKRLMGRASITSVETMLSETNRTARFLNSFACAFMDAKRYEHIDEIEAWVRAAVEKEPDNHAYHGTLARVLTLRGVIDESLREISISMMDRKTIESDLNEPIDVFSYATAAGLGKEALEIIASSPCADLLEPLIVGINLYLGNEVKAPQEVREVAGDILKRIKEGEERHLGIQQKKV
jgi:Archaeal ATPase.